MRAWCFQRWAAGLLGVVIAAAVSLPAAAEPAETQSLTEAQKRRLHLPYVKAATDCYARAIATNATWLDMARDGDWLGAAAKAFPLCRAPLIDMIQEHDRLFGPDTGGVFARGPYAADLPRALATRLKDVIELRSAEVARQQGERKQSVSSAERARDVLEDRM